jgi:hypothetical protein
MEMAGKQFSPFMEMVVYHVLQLVQVCLTVYGNGCATMSYSSCNYVLRFMEMVGKQFSPFMKMVMQPCLTACATMSYSLCNYVLQIVQLRLTVYGNGWQAVLPIYGNGFRSGTSKNQWLHKKLGNSENRVTYRLR